MDLRIGIAVEELFDVRAAVQRVHDLAASGFPAAWFGHYAGGYDPLTVIPAAATRAHGMELGTAVLPTYPRHPMVLAQQALGIQALIDGGLVLGIGPSHAFVVERIYGASFGSPVRHVEEYLTVLRALVCDGMVDFEGDTVRASGRMGIVGAQPCPILLGALGPRMLGLAGRLADGTITFAVGARGLGEYVVPTIASAAQGAGRPPPRVVAMLSVCLTNDVADVRARLAERLGSYDTMPEFRRVLERQGETRVADIAVVGDERAVASELRSIEAAGATDLNAHLFGTPEEVRRTEAFLRSLL